MKKKLWISLGVVILIVGLVGVNVFRAANNEVPSVKTASIEEREITENVMVPGTLSLSEEEFIYLEADKGEISEVLVKEGDTVDEGTPLVKYDNEQLQLEKEQNALSIESANIRINQIEDQIDSLDDKEEDLAKQMSEEEAEAQIDVERDQLKADLKVAEMEARQHLLQKETLEEKINELVVSSKMAGTVLSIDQDALNGIAQTPILHIGKEGEYIVKASISEYDSLKIAKNQPVILKSDVIPDTEWKGTVSEVSVLPVKADSAPGAADTAVQYPIVVSIENKDIKAKPGFKLVMDIETGKRKVQAVPLEAVKQDGENYYVFSVADGKVMRKDVELGAVSDKFMELKSGLENGEVIVVNPADSLENGMEVSVE